MLNANIYGYQKRVYYIGMKLLNNNPTAIGLKFKS